MLQLLQTHHLTTPHPDTQTGPLPRGVAHPPPKKTRGKLASLAPPRQQSRTKRHGKKGPGTNAPLGNHQPLAAVPHTDTQF